MFTNLRNELFKKQITMKAFADFLAVSEKTVQNKMSGKTEFTFSEVAKTNRIRFPEFTWDYIFATDADDKAS